MDIKTVNYILDFALIGASLWMLFTVRGIGGIVGRSLNLIIAGAIVLGLAHLIADVMVSYFKVPADVNNLVHRLIVLGGFVLTALGFQQVRQLTR